MVDAPERIAAAAVYYGACISLPPPARHHTILQTMDGLMGVDGTLGTPDRQGFITSAGRYVNRVEAYGVAYRAGQVSGGGPELYSEDLW